MQGVGGGEDLGYEGNTAGRGGTTFTWLSLCTVAVLRVSHVFGPLIRPRAVRSLPPFCIGGNEGLEGGKSVRVVAARVLELGLSSGRSRPVFSVTLMRHLS